MQPTRAGYINAMQVYPYSDGALYQVYAAPGQVTDIALAPGEQLVGSGPVAAGDTVRWVIGDTESGTGQTKQMHILIKPTRPDLVTNLVINTDRRTYHLELRSTERTYMASVSWAYAQDQLIALRRQNAAAEAATAIASGVDINALNFRYRIEGDNPPWRPLRAFDDGRQVFIAFPTGIGQGEMPPLWVIGAGRRCRAGQLPDPRQSHDRRPAVRRGRAPARRRTAEEGPHRADGREAAVVTDASSDPADAVREMRKGWRCAFGQVGRLSCGFRARLLLPLVWSRPSQSPARCSLLCSASRRLLAPSCTTPTIARRLTASIICRVTTLVCPSPYRSWDRRYRAISVGRSLTQETRRHLRLLILLCHKVGFAAARAQAGHRSSCRKMARASRKRRVAMEFGTWRCIRPAAARRVALG